MVAPYKAEGDSFHAEKPRAWSDTRVAAPAFIRMFDLHADGARFAVPTSALPMVDLRTDRLVFILNFFDELRSRPR